MKTKTRAQGTGIPHKTLKRLLESMALIRRFEERLCELYPAQDMKTPIHLSIGQEAIAAGVSANLKKADYILSTHRSHGHYIAKGGDIRLLMAELYGKKTGCSKGKGGSMHLASPEVGMPGTSAIVGGGIPIAVGAALGFVLQKKKNVAVTFFGDGAVESGLFHESLNFAALKKLPVVFVCENNFYATNSPLLARQPLDNIYQKAAPYGIPGVRVDGNDPVAVYRASKEALMRARSGKGPSLLECRTYRIKQHVGPDTDHQSGCRPKEELEHWLKKDPIKRFEKLLLQKNIMKINEVRELYRRIDERIDDALEFAQKSPAPEAADLYEGLY